MKKTLLAVAVAAALPAAAFAQTNVTLSGNIKMGVGSYKFSNGAANNGSGNAIGDGSSKFIISGTEDLGGGLKAMFQWDNRLRADEGTGPSTSGNSFVGLAGGFGMVRMGRLDQYYFIGVDGHGAAATALTASSISVLSYVNGAAAAAPATRTGNIVRYDAPAMGGLKFGIGYSFAPSGAEGFAAAGKGSQITADVMYAAGPLSAALAMADGKNEDKSAATKGIRGTVAYNFGMFTAGVTVDKSENKQPAAGTSQKRTAWSIPLSAKLGPGTAMFTYTKAGDVNGTSDTGATFVTVGYDYPLSKRTSLGVSYAVLNNDSGAKYNMFTSAALHNMPVAGVGQDSKQLYIGVNHKY